MLIDLDDEELKIITEVLTRSLNAEKFFIGKEMTNTPEFNINKKLKYFLEEYTGIIKC